MAVINSEKNWNEYVASAETVSRSPGFRSLRDRILELADLAAGDEVLDIGAGTGLLTLPAAQAASRVWALDASHGMCDYVAAKAKSARLGNVEAVNASVVSIPLIDETVTAAISNYCFHHLNARDKLVALAEVERVLAPGGRLVLGDMMFSMSVADPQNREVVSAKVRGLLAKGPGGAWRLARNGARYLTRRWEHPATPEWWCQALESVGFREVEVEALEHEGGIAVARKPARWVT